MDGRQCGNVLVETIRCLADTPDSGDQCMRLIEENEPLCINLAALYASENGQLDCLRFLLNKGAEVNAKDTKGNSLLAKAVAHPSCVRFLIEQGADVNSKDKDCSTALMKAVAGGHKRSVKILLSAKPFVNARNRYGSTALIQAVRHRRTNCAGLLLENSADVNMEDNEGNSALVHAASKQSVDCVKLLLNCGAVIDRNTYESMFSLLRSWETAIVNKQIILMLFAGGADRPQTNQGETSIYWRDLAQCLRPYSCHRESSLQQMCRSSIRKHLLRRHSMTNLYFTTNKLNLPHLLRSYLLFNVVLSEKQT